MDIAITGFIILSILTVWLGQFLQSMDRKGTIVWLTGFAFSMYSLHLLLFALASALQPPSTSLVLARLSFTATMLALLVCHTIGWRLQYPQRRLLHVPPTALIVYGLGAVFIYLSITTPLIIANVITADDLLGSRVQPGPLYMATCFYLISVLLLSANAFMAGHDLDTMNTPHPVRKTVLKPWVVVSIVQLSILFSEIGTLFNGVAALTALLLYVLMTPSVVNTLIYAQALLAERPLLRVGELVRAGLLTSATLMVVYGLMHLMRVTDAASWSLMAWALAPYGAVLMVSGQVKLFHVDALWASNGERRAYAQRQTQPQQAQLQPKVQASASVQARLKLQQLLQNAPSSTPLPLDIQLTDVLMALGQAMQVREICLVEQRNGVARIQAYYAQPDVPTTQIALLAQEPYSGLRVLIPNHETWQLWMSGVSTEASLAGGADASQVIEAVNKADESMTLLTAVSAYIAQLLDQMTESGSPAVSVTSSLPALDMTDPAEPSVEMPPEVSEVMRETPKEQALYKDVRQALRHLHDPAYLGTLNQLTAFLAGTSATGGGEATADAAPIASATSWERGEILQQQLILVLRSLQPGDAVTNHATMQRFQILWRLYYEGHSRTDIMRDLSISERHYERMLREALENVAAQWVKRMSVSSPTSEGNN